MARPKIRTDEDYKRYQREWYLRNREKCIARATDRKRRIAAEKRAERDALQAALDEYGLKICAKCDEMRPRDEFPRARDRKDGLYPYCKPCQSATAADWKRRNKADTHVRRRGNCHAVRHHGGDS